MVKFSEYFESMVKLKPEWRNAYIDYPKLNALLTQIKRNVHCVPHPNESTQSLSTVNSPQASEATPLVAAAVVDQNDKPPSSAVEDEDAFVLQRGISTVPVPIVSSAGSEERMSFQGSVPLPVHPHPYGHGAVPYSQTPPLGVSNSIRHALGTPPMEHSHKVFGTAFRVHRMETAMVRQDSSRDPDDNASPLLEQAPLTKVVASTLPNYYTTSYGASDVSPPLASMSHLQSMHPPTPPIPEMPASVAHGGMTNPTTTPVLPLMSEDGVSAARTFEDLLLSEVTKSAVFAEQSFESFAEFVESNREKWLAGKAPKARVKDTLRYLHKEAEHLVQFIETNELAIKTATKKYLHSHPFYIRDEVREEKLLPRFDNVSSNCAQLQGVIASLWARLFMGGDITAARTRITAASASSTQSFRAGVFFALIIACGLYWLHVRFELQPTADVIAKTNIMFPIVRLFVTLLFALVCWSWVLYIFERYRINYLFVFEFSQSASTSWMQCLEYSLGMFFLCCLFGVLYVRSELHDRLESCYATAGGFNFLSPYVIPCFLTIFIATIVFPIRHVFHKTRNAFGRVFFKCMKLPFGDVRFVEFFVADWGTSLVYPCGDLLYLVCFYTATAQHAFSNHPSGDCAEVEAKYNFPVAMIPYFWRACQTFKMYRKTGVTAHIVNHGKYQTFLMYFVISWLNALWPCDALNALGWVLHFAAQLYAWVWDILMDWGWIKGRSRSMMFKTKSPYIIAAVVDFVLRMYFVFCTLYIQPILGADYMLLIQGTVEVFRRSMWSIFRIENENINNLEMYRKIDFVPHVAPRDELS